MIDLFEKERAAIPKHIRAIQAMKHTHQSDVKHSSKPDKQNPTKDISS